MSLKEIARKQGGRGQLTTLHEQEFEDEPIQKNVRELELSMIKKYK